jgi:hypothetical protein
MMPHFWITYRDSGRLVGVVIMEAPSLIRAGLRAIRSVGAGATFADGHELSADQVALVPAGKIGRMLPADEAESHFGEIGSHHLHVAGVHQVGDTRDQRSGRRLASTDDDVGVEENLAGSGGGHRGNAREEKSILLFVDLQSRTPRLTGAPITGGIVGARGPPVQPDFTPWNCGYR